MTNKASERRQKVIEAAASMLATHGLRGISIREVVKYANAPLGSTYHNFPEGKYQIIAEAISWAGNLASTELQTCLNSRKHNGIELFLENWKVRLLKSDFNYGCPIVAAAIEAPKEAEAQQINDAVVAVFSKWEKLLADYLMPQGYSEEEASCLANGIISSIEGAIVLCRSLRSAKPLDNVKNFVQQILNKN